MVLPLILATIAGFYAWWTGRQLVRHLDDPALAELLMARSSRVTLVLLACLTLTLLLAWEHAWAAGLAVLAVLAGWFPARRRIFEEEWGLLAYLSHHLKLMVGLFGAWIVVLFLPLIYVNAAAALGVVAPVVVALVLVWSVFGSAVLRHLVGARLLDDRDLQERFQAVLAKARCPLPAIYRAGAPGGRWVNGFALPVPWAPAVLLTDDLIAHLEPAETAAIFAHEVAHLEEFTTAKWLGRVLIPPLLAGLISAVFAVGVLAGVATAVVGALWPLACLLVLAAALTRSRKTETESDLRAVELTGDADALVRALTKIHALARLPRRLSNRVQQRITHPSLARRLQAVRRAAGLEPAVETPSSVAVRSPGADATVVVLRSDRLEWLDGVPAAAEVTPALGPALADSARVVKYTELSELRIDARTPGRHALVAVDRDGRKISVRVTTADAGRVQAFLDEIDLHLGTAPTEEVPGWARASSARITAVLAVVAGLLPPAAWALSLTSAVVLVRPSRVALAAAGAVGVVSVIAGALGLVPTAWDVSELWIVHGIRTVLALQFIAAAVVRGVRRLHDPLRVVHAQVAVLAVFGIVSAAPALTTLPTPLGPMHFHLWVQSLPLALVVLVGVMAALVTVPRRPYRLGAAGLLLGLGAAAVAGTSWTRERVTGDALRTTPTRLVPEAAELEQVAQFPVEGAVLSLDLSPSGRWVAVGLGAGDDEWNGRGAAAFAVYGPAGVRRVQGSSLRWVDDESIVVLAPRGGAFTLTWVELATRRTWTLELPDIPSPRLTVGDGAWTVVSRYPVNGHLVAFAGVLGSTALREHRWRLDEFVAFHEAGADAVGRVVVVGRRYDDGLGSLGLLLGFGGSAATGTGELWTGHGDSLRRFAQTAHMLSCIDPGVRRVVCLANSRRVTELWSLGAGTDQLIPLGRVGGWRWAEGDGDALVLHSVGPELLLVDVDGVRVWAVRHEALAGDAAAADATGWERAVGYRAETLAVARGDARASTVTLFRIR